MMPVLTIVDDFLGKDRCENIRQEVLTRGFKTEMIKEISHLPEVPYENVNIEYNPPDFSEKLPEVFGRPVVIDKQAFRLGARNSPLHNLVHADHCCSDLAAVYFLNPLAQCKGGTAFWRHKTFGWEMMPTQEELDRVGYSLKELGDDWHNPGAWELVSVAGMRQDRLITYSTHCFHSRWPWQGFGLTPATSRLIWCGFLNLS